MKRSILKYYKVIIIPLFILCILLWFFTATANLDNSKKLEDKQNLEEALRRSTVLCYAVEGAYPPDLEYLVKNYGVQIDSDRFTVKYEIYASNLMPDITVLEHQQ